MRKVFDSRKSCSLNVFLEWIFLFAIVFSILLLCEYVVDTLAAEINKAETASIGNIINIFIAVGTLISALGLIWFSYLTYKNQQN
ncbi:MAG: hypothetical protein Q4E77_06895, partial [Conchiformibius sp.]|nr:hypothetical protein [Conchiformibius sp.]